MSIILKGIDLPKGEELLTVSIYDGFISVYTVTPEDTVIEHKAQAIQIPKGHGRIGDLDGVIKQIDESPTFASKYKGTAKLFIDVYSDSNTILEAEGEER